MTAEQFKEIRKNLALNKSQMARLLGVRQPMIIKWESGQRTIPKYIEQAIFFFLGLSPKQQQLYAEGARMKILEERVEGIPGAADALEIKFLGGESTLVKYDEAFPIQQQVFQVCDLNEVDLGEVVSSQVIRQALILGGDYEWRKLGLSLL